MRGCGRSRSASTVSSYGCGPGPGRLSPVEGLNLEDEPSLDRTADPWVGRFPGLGSVTVHSDGAVSVVVEPGGKEAALREGALRYGWGEALSFLRRGFHLASGAAVCPPSNGPACVILNGNPHDTAILIIELTRVGWTVMGDRFTPTVWQGDHLVAWPRQAPLIVSETRLATAGLKGTKVRDDTDAHAVDLPRTLQPHPVAAVCAIETRKAGQPTLERLIGHERFQAASSMMLGGALRRPDDDTASGQPPALVAEHLRLARLTYVRLRSDSRTAAQDAETLDAWCDEHGGAARDRG